MNGSGLTDNQLLPQMATLTSPRMLETAEFWVSLVAVHRVAGGSFPNGNVGMELAWWGMKGVWDPPNKPLQFDYDIATPPHGPSGGANVQYPAALNGLAIAANAKHPEEAMEWIKYLLSTRIMEPATIAGGGVPTRKSVVTSWLRIDDKNNRAVLTPLSASVPTYPVTAGWSEIERLMRSPVARAFNGETSISMVLRELNDPVSALLKQYQ